MNHRRRARRPNRREPSPDERRALSNVGGAVVVASGEGSIPSALESALDVGSDDEATRAHVHGFHSYAARMHPLTARRLIDRLSRPGDLVVDPFAGSGTVLVEARLLARRAIGSDLNPLAVLLARLKTRGTTERERSFLVEGATEVAAHAEERRQTKAGPSKRYSSRDRELFDVHVLLELDGLAQGLSFLEAGFVRDALELVLSSIIVKVSRQPGDTANATVARRLASGFTIRLFQKKTEELARQLAEFAALLPRRPPPCRVEVEDARRLTSVPAGSASLIVTSPPYPGVYDYATQHAVRLQFLKLPAGDFERGEIGARRKLDAMPHDSAVSAWEKDLGKCVAAMRRALDVRGLAVLIVADSVIASRPLFADRVIFDIAEKTGMKIVASAAQVRPHFHAESRRAFASRPRREHAIVLSRA